MPPPLDTVLPSQLGAGDAPAVVGARWRAWLPAARAGALRPLLPLLAALAVLAALGGWLLHGQAALGGAVASAEAAERMVGRLAALATVSAAAEAAQRGHALAGDPALLAPLREAPARQAALLAELRDLSAADAAQYARVLALAPLLARRGEQLAAGAELRQRGGAAGQAAALATLDDRRLPEQIQRALAELQAHAEAAAAAAREQAAASAGRVRLVTVLAGLLAMALTAAALLRAGILAARVGRLQHEHRTQQQGDVRLKQVHARLVESALAPILFIDREGRVRRSNPAADALAGAGGTLPGRPFVDFVLPEDQRRSERALEAAAGGTPQTLQHRWRRADGTLLHLRWSLAALDDAGGLVAVAQDDTEARTQAEAAARDAAAFAQARQAQACADERAAAAEARLADFLATLSRCLYQPLSALQQQASNGQRGLHGAQDAAVARAWAQVLERTRHAQQAVEHVLLLGRIEAGALALQHEAFDVWDTLRRTVDQVQDGGGRRGLRVELALAEDLGYAHGDLRRVEQALVQLLQEAAGSSSDGVLQVAARRGAQGLIHFEVAHRRGDGGAADLDALLAPLHDADRPASAEQLIRLLGVAMARALLRRMGGRLAVSLQPERGCVFELTLPADPLPQH